MNQVDAELVLGEREPEAHLDLKDLGGDEHHLRVESHPAVGLVEEVQVKIHL